MEQQFLWTQCRLIEFSEKVLEDSFKDLLRPV